MKFPFCIAYASHFAVDCGYQLIVEWFRFDSHIHPAPASFHDLIVAFTPFDSLGVASFQLIVASQSSVASLVVASHD